MEVRTSGAFVENKMKKENCKWHGGTKLPSEVRGKCLRCEKALQETSDLLNRVFSGLTIDFGKDGEPRVVESRN